MSGARPAPRAVPERAKGSDVAEPSGKHVRVAMVDDHPAFRLGLSRLLERNADFEVVWSAASVQQALRNFERSPVDLVIMDLQFGDGVNGLDGLKILRKRWPDTRVLMVSAFADQQTVAAARAAGVAGAVSKELPLGDLYSAIRQAATRGKVRSIEGSRKAPLAPTGVVQSERLSKLTGRELEVLDEIRRGMTNREIALRLGVSTTTVNKHVHRVLAKLGARNRTQAAIVR